MNAKLINNKLSDTSRKKLYLTLTFILLLFFLTIFVNQFPSAYTNNSFAASTSSSLSSPVYLAVGYGWLRPDIRRTAIEAGDSVTAGESAGEGDSVRALCREGYYPGGFPRWSDGVREGRNRGIERLAAAGAVVGDEPDHRARRTYAHQHT